MTKQTPGLLILLLSMTWTLAPAQTTADLRTAAPRTIRYNLSGTDKDHTVDWDFFCTKGRKSGVWTKIAVPSNWEQQGFGGYNYGHDKVKWDEEGLYRHTFQAPTAWKGKRAFIVFEGAMTDVEVKINGQQAGTVHQGGFYRFKYDITSLLKPGEENLLEVKVSKMSSNASVNHAERQGDFWVFGGIYRPVYLEILPSSFIDRVAVDAKADGSLHADVYTGGMASGIPGSVSMQVRALDGKALGGPVTARLTGRADDDKVSLKGITRKFRAWNPEFPVLYELEISLFDEKGRILHQVRQRFGFRTVEVRPQDGIYVNGKRVILKGVDHHSEWPETGRTLSPSVNRMDVQLIKEMNMNAVRMSHYPPDQDFLDCCDSLGLFVLDELTGWQAKYDTLVGHKLVKELVVRDVNHPSVIFWDNGNEGGFNRGLDNDFALYDPQGRTVLHPWERFNNIDTKHYPTYNYVVNAVLYDKDIFMPTEFMHGLYDGGAGAGLDDFWNLMMKHPSFGGGFIWVFHDEAISRTDKDGWLDTDGNHAPDGIVGPHREKEGSFYTIKEIWSPVQVRLDKVRPDFDGRIPVENYYFYTNLRSCTFSWKLMTLDGKLNAAGVCRTADIGPGKTGELVLNLPPQWVESDVIYLKASDPHGKEIFTWSWPISSPRQIVQKNIKRDPDPSSLTAQETENGLVVRSGAIVYSFDKKTGYLVNVVNGDRLFPLHNGPAQAGLAQRLQQFRWYAAGKDYIVEPKYVSDSFTVKWTFSPGLPAKLEYSYLQKNDADYAGITFDYPEDSITGMTWTGNGPYRVWKNRLKGGNLGLWHKAYNNTVTGESWDYPEFKGYHAHLYWVRVEQKGKPFIVYTENENLFLQMLKPTPPKGAGNDNTAPAFPEGNIGFMNMISPIGTKFKPATDMGPQSQKNMMLNYTPVKGVLWFDFR